MTYETLTETEWDQVGRIWDLLDEGHTDRARTELDALSALRRGHPDVRIVEAAVLLDEGEAKRALEALSGAERSADPALFFHLRAAAHYERADFEQARADAERAVTVNPDLAEAHELISRACEFLGEEEEARDHAETAHEIDPEASPEPLEMEDAEFDRLVEKAVAELPKDVSKHLAELPVLVESLPRREVLTAEEPPISPDVLGLFVGRHLLERSVADLPGAPGVIFLFRKNLLRVCADREELEREVRITVQHEVGHLLGLDEDDLERWGLA